MSHPSHLLDRAIAFVEGQSMPTPEGSAWLAETRAYLEPPTVEHQRLIDRARELYGSNELEIDDDAALSDGDDDGTWVAAWVWLADPTCDTVANPKVTAPVRLSSR